MDAHEKVKFIKEMRWAQYTGPPENIASFRRACDNIGSSPEMLRLIVQISPKLPAHGQKICQTKNEITLVD